MELRRQLRIEKIDGNCVRFEPVTNTGPIGPAGTGIAAIIVETIEATPDATFYGTAASCAGFENVLSRRSN